MAYKLPGSVFALVVVYYLTLGLGVCTSVHSNAGVPVKTLNVTEGDQFETTCETTSLIVYWSNNVTGFKETGKILSFFKTKKNEAGIYTCYKTEILRQDEVLEVVNINVQYPPKLTHVSNEPGPQHENDTFTLSVQVEGNPAPNTTFTADEDGDIAWQRVGAGQYNVTVGPLTCADGGTYTLASQNALGHDTHQEEILVYCPPELSPRLPIHDNLKPRLGDDVTIKVINAGYPYPAYNWTYNGRVVSSHDKHFESDVELRKFKVDEFGDYTLTMTNDLGQASHTFTVEANGPPGPVIDLAVTGVWNTSVNLTWVSGFDYGNKQNYVVMAYDKGKYKGVASFDAKDGDHGFANVSHEVKGLESGMMYNLSVFANNSRGPSSISSRSVVFTTAPYTTYTVVEGNSLFVMCNGTLPGATVYWTRGDRSVAAEGKQLAFFNTTRDDMGIYLCNEVVKTTVVTKETVFIDVQYPGRILNAKVWNADVFVNQTFDVRLSIDGNPTPTTTISQYGNILYTTKNTGTFNASVEIVSCAEFGQIWINCSNTFGNDTRTSNLTVYCAPIPKGKVHTKLQPRLGENATLKIEEYGFPAPLYTWSFNGTVLKNESTGNTDDYEVQTVKIADFGMYKLEMSNDLGKSIVNYSLEAYGPPEPATKLGFNNITVSTVNLTFVSGFDYGAHQNFLVQSFNGKAFQDIASFDDKTTSHRPVNVSHVIDHLKFGTQYNLSIVANNSRGMSQRSPVFVIFTTKVPYDTFETLEGNNFTLTCNASSNMTNVHWETKSGQRKSSGEELEIDEINRDDSGFYECIGYTQNTTRHKIEGIFIDVQYPAKILNISISDKYLYANDSFYIELSVEGHPKPKISLTKERDGSMVYFRNETGMFNITIDPVECTDTGKYKLNCSNKIGNDMAEEEIFVFCPPVVDPKAHITKQFYPRLGNKTMIQIENYGYPYPNYTWTHGAKTLQHDDTDIGSHVTVNVTVDDFGNYLLDMDNTFGDVNVSFQLIPKGPPEPVSGLKIINSTYNSVTLSWISGYNYGSPQLFMVMTTDGKNLANFTDSTNGGYGTGVYTVMGLDSSTPYKLTVVSHNKDGDSSAPPGDVQFTTAAAPKASSSHKKAIIGGVIGAVCVLGILVVVGIFLKRRKDRRTRYENLDEDFN